MTDLPTGTVTFLFTDIESSTRLLQDLGERWPGIVEEHNRVMREAIRQAEGVDVRTEGDAVFAVFQSAPSAVSAAVAAQRAMASATWAKELRVRMGLHTGEGVRGGGDYVGLDVHRAARIAAAAHGGQVLLSAVTRWLVEEALPGEVSIRALGRHRLKDLPQPEELHQLVIDGLPSEFPPPHTLEVPVNLPAPLTAFVGREAELGRLKDLLAEARLLTLTGPGGSGKTRLAIEAAGGLLDSFADGTFFVDLAPIREPELVPSTIAQTLGVREEATRPILEPLKEALHDQELLLILDNFEQLLDGAALVTELVAAAPRLRVMVTSRAPLHLSGEQEFPVLPMAIPASDLAPARLSEYEAVELFVERARAIDPSFTLNEENGPAVAEICRRLEGLPLAIELAASRIRLLPPEALAERLERRLSLLTGGARDAPARQRTLRQTIAWSHDLLDEEERALFRRLSVFAGGWTLEAAEAVGGQDLASETMDVLGSLVDRSLARREGPRFRMLETIREFGIDALDRSGETDAVRRRHAEHFLAVAEAAEPELTRRDPGLLDTLEMEHDNIRAALRWSIETDEAEPGMRMAGALWRFWQMRDHMAEGRRWTDEVLELPSAAAPSAARARALLAAGSLNYYLRDTGSVRGLYEESLKISRTIGDRRGEAEGMYNLGFGCMLAGDFPAAKEFELRAEEAFRELGDHVRLAHVYIAQAMVAGSEGDFEAERRFLRRARTTFEELGDLWALGVITGQMGAVAIRAGDQAAARAATLESLGIAERLGNSLGIAVGLEGLGVVAILEGQTEAGLRLAGAAARVKEELGGEPPPELLGMDDPRELSKNFLAEEQITALWDEGRAMTLDQALALARLEPQR